MLLGISRPLQLVRGFVIDSRVSHRISATLFSTPAATAAARPPTQKKGPNTGGLRRLPVVKSPVELCNRSRRETQRVKADADIKNARKRARKHATESLNTLTQSLCIPLRDVVNGYKSELRRLHPFEKVVADLTARARQKKDGLTLQDVLNEIHESRKMILEAGKEWVARAKYAETAREAGEAMNEGTEYILNLYQQHASKPVSEILELQRSLRGAPVIQLDTPAIVLVGVPNVGKSSIVRTISSGTPEVNNYPFTTRGMTLGHVEVFWSDNSSIAKAAVPDERRKPGSLSQEVVMGKYAFSQLCQIMDSPGLLLRDNDEDRNEMESLTMAAMQHLPTAVIYVMDLTGEAGDKFSSVSDQLELRRRVRARFPRRPWIDVVSKADKEVVDGSLEELEEILDGAPYLRVSALDGTGIDGLRTEVLRMLGEVRLVLDAISTDPNMRP